MKEYFSRFRKSKIFIKSMAVIIAAVLAGMVNMPAYGDDSDLFEEREEYKQIKSDRERRTTSYKAVGGKKFYSVKEAQESARQDKMIQKGESLYYSGEEIPFASVVDASKIYTSEIQGGEMKYDAKMTKLFREKVMKAAEKEGLVSIAVNDDGKTEYFFKESVDGEAFDKIVLKISSSTNISRESVKTVLKESVSAGNEKPASKGIFEKITSGIAYAYGKIKSLAAWGIETVKGKKEEKKARENIDEEAEEIFYKIANGYMSPERLEEVLVALAARFESVGEMEDYLEVRRGEESKENISKAMVRKIGEALALWQSGEFSEEEKDAEISILRGAAEVLMSAAADAEIKEKFGEIKDEDGIIALQRMMTKEIRVNMRVAAKAMADEITVEENKIHIGKEIEINISELKDLLEKPGLAKLNMFNKSKEALLADIKALGRGHESFMTPMDIRNAKAIAS